MESWTFNIEDDNRRATLLAPTTFEEIVGRIQHESTILCWHPEGCCDAKWFTSERFFRVVYCLEMDESLFDVFFNSPHGYRGAYYRSPYSGLEANALFIETLLPKLLASSGHDRNERVFAKESLTSPSAKVWLAEHGREQGRECIGEWSSDQADGRTEISNDRWEHCNSANGPGRKAWLYTKLKIFGAFLNDQHDEFIPKRKRHRARDIFECGWS
jgi:hypothetical protein